MERHCALCCTDYPWCPTIAVAAALGTNVIEFVAGQYFHKRATALAAAAAACGVHSCGAEHDPEVSPADAGSDPRTPLTPWPCF